MLKDKSILLNLEKFDQNISTIVNLSEKIHVKALNLTEIHPNIQPIVLQ